MAGNARKTTKAERDREALLARIAEMPDEDRALAERVHELVTTAAPDLAPKLYYGQPGYARPGGKVVCFFRSGQMDGEPYSTFGFSAEADLEDPSGMWPTAYGLGEMTEEAWQRLADLVARAAT